MAGTTYVDGQQAQDIAASDLLRSGRQYLNVLMNTALGSDQVYYDTDGNPTNPSGQFTVYDPSSGTTVFAGRAGVVTPSGAPALSPLAWLLIIGAGLWLATHH